MPHPPTEAERLAAELNRYLHPPEWEPVLRNYPWHDLIDWEQMARADPLGWWRVAILRDGTVLNATGTGRRKRWVVYPPGADLQILMTGEVIDLQRLPEPDRVCIRRFAAMAASGIAAAAFADAAAAWIDCPADLRRLRPAPPGAPVAQVLSDLCRRLLLAEGKRILRR